MELKHQEEKLRTADEEAKPVGFICWEGDGVHLNYPRGFFKAQESGALDLAIIFLSGQINYDYMDKLFYLGTSLSHL